MPGRCGITGGLEWLLGFWGFRYTLFEKSQRGRDMRAGKLIQLHPGPGYINSLQQLWLPLSGVKGREQLRSKRLAVESQVASKEEGRGGAGCRRNCPLCAAMNAAQPGTAVPAASATPGSQKKKRKKKLPRRKWLAFAQLLLWSVDFSKNRKGFSLAVIKKEQASTGVHVQRNKSRIKALKDTSKRGLLKRGARGSCPARSALYPPLLTHMH